MPQKIPSGTSTYAAHGVRLDLTNWLSDYNKASEHADEICKRISVLRRSIEEAGLWLDKFEKAWGTPPTLRIWLSHGPTERKIRKKYWDKKASKFRDGYSKARDPLDEYYIEIMFLREMEDDKDLPKGKVRSLAIFLQNAEYDAPVGNVAFNSKSFVF